MDLMMDIVLDAGKDTLALVPFLFVTYLLLEALEHAAGQRVNDMVQRAGAAGPLVGALAGVVPQCGFSAVGATLYAGRVVTLGTLVAVLLSTSDEMLPLLVAERVDAGTVGKILGLKVFIALVTGFLIDLGVRAVRSRLRARSVHSGVSRDAVAASADLLSQVDDLMDDVAEAGSGVEHIHRLCEQDHCGCDDGAACGLVGVACDEDDECEGHEGRGAAQDGDTRSGHGHDDHGHSHAGHGHAHEHTGNALTSIVRSACSHTLQVAVFIFLVSFVLVAVLETAGEPALEAMLGGNTVLTVIFSALVGLIPNCSASVAITQLYLAGVLGFAPLMAGLLVSAGIGYLVLFRANRRPRENLLIVALMLLASVAWGLVLLALGL